MEKNPMIINNPHTFYYEIKDSETGNVAYTLPYSTINAPSVDDVVPAVIAAVDDLTNWYVRRSRRRFWKSENDGDKNAAYATMYKVLVDFSKILAPFLPLLAEEIYQILVREVDANAPVSVHLCEFPSADKSLMDEKLVERIAMVRGMVEMGRVIRATNNVKNRMPIASMTVVAHGTEEKNVAETMKDLILEELNVEEMKFLEDESSLVECSAKPNFLNIKSDFSSYFGQPFL